MGAGIAAQISNRYPTAYDADLRTLKGDLGKMGTYSSTWVMCNSKRGGSIVNAYTQYNPGNNLSYEALAAVLYRLNEDYAGYHIGFPQIGCGIGGGDWKTVRAMIRDHMRKCRVTVVIYDPE
jgi:O-acetyl-ADP-ribose deacetylase (regulator of RNase III)